MAIVLLVLVLSLGTSAGDLHPAPPAHVLPGRDGLPRGAGAARPSARTSPASTWRCPSAASWAGSSTPWSPRSSSTGSRSTPWPWSWPAWPCPASAPVRARRWDRAVDFASPWPRRPAGRVVRRPAWPGSVRRARRKLACGVAAFLCYTLKDRPVRFALAVGAVLLAVQGVAGRRSAASCSRSGTSSASCGSRTTPEGNSHRLVHGNTLHGQQGLDPRRRREPLTYYHRTGPIGQVFEAFARGPPGRTWRSSASGPGRWPATPSPARAGPSTRSTRRSCGSPATRATSPS